MASIFYLEVMRLKNPHDEEDTPIARGMIVRPVVFFSEWLGIVLTSPKQYEPTDEDNDMLIYAPQSGPPNPYASYQWDGVKVVDVYWFTEGERTEEFVDFLESCVKVKVKLTLLPGGVRAWASLLSGR